MKIFKFIFLLTLSIIVIIIIANQTGLTRVGIDFQTLEEHEKFISNFIFWGTVTTYIYVIASLNLVFGGILFLVRGVRSQVSRRKDVLVGILLIVFPIVAWFCYLVLTGMQSAHWK